MSDKEFATRVKMLADKSEYSEEEKKGFSLLVAYACDTDKRERLICDYLKKDGITFKGLIDFVLSIIPPVEIVDDDEGE